MPPVAPPALAQDKVVVGGGAHGIKHVGFVGDLQLFSAVELLKEAEVVTLDVLHVVFFESSLDHLRRVVLTGQQNAFVDVSIADTLHADPDDAQVGDLLVVDGQRGLRGAAGRRRRRRRLGAQQQRGGAEVRMGGAAGGAGQAGRGRRHGAEILGHVVEGAREGLQLESEEGRLRSREVLHVRAAGARRRNTDLISVGLSGSAVVGRSQCGELLGEQAAAPGVRRVGTGVDRRLQLTGEFIALLVCEQRVSLQPGGDVRVDWKVVVRT